jgi:hypothetical protein
VRGRDPVIMGLSCMDDYNTALNPITSRDGEHGAAAGEGLGCFQNESGLLTSHTYTHTHTSVQ